MTQSAGVLFLLGGILVTAYSFAEEAGTVVTAEEALHRKVVKGQAIYYGDVLKISEKSRIVFDEPARVYLRKLEMKKDAVIDAQGSDLQFLVKEDVFSEGGFIDVSTPTGDDWNLDNSGAPGVAGEDGVKAMDALKGAPGAHGGDGAHGTSGGDADEISIVTPYLHGNVYLISRGGDGGNGGRGGDGGNGGAGFSGMDARTLYYFRGLDNLPIATLIELGAMIGVPYVGQVLAILSIFNGIRIGDGFDGFDGGAGGNGGRGGNGGDGGSGGKVELIFGFKDAQTKIYVDTRGGRAGSPGIGGMAGLGGVGGAGGERGDIWAREGKPGKSGAAGITGTAGVPGRPGQSGKIRVVQTEDPQWVNCYVTYRELVDVTEDPAFAAEYLKICSTRI